MNERIRELANQAFDTAEYPEDQQYRIEPNPAFCKKFAELIVTDAISVLQKRFMGDLNREDMEVRRCIEDIQKHFGI
jgi:hypothetical protein